MQKKGQATIFMVLGLLLILALVSFFFINKSVKERKIEAEAERLTNLNERAEQIKNFVDSCIRKVAFDGMRLLGKQGGYIEIPDLVEFQGQSYWYFNQVNIQPTLNLTQERLIKHINENVPKCVEDEAVKQQGFDIKKGNISTAIEFANLDVFIKVNYPITLTLDDFKKEYEEFSANFDLRYRRTFEMATEVNKHLYDPDFDVRNPLKNVDKLDFEVSYNKTAGNLIFEITDKTKVAPDGNFFRYRFAGKFGLSSLRRTTAMQNNSATNPTLLPYSIYSVDKKASLLIEESATLIHQGASVEGIAVIQYYPDEVVAYQIPVFKHGDKIEKREDLRYVLDNPIYDFNPDGMRFNKPQLLALYYEDESKASEGTGILAGHGDFFAPIFSTEDKAEKKVSAFIPGFTNFTAVHCSSQPIKTAQAKHTQKPSAVCWVMFAITVAAIIFAFYVFFLGPGVGVMAPVTGAGAETTTLAAMAPAGPALTGGEALGALAAGTLTIGGSAALGLALTAISYLSLFNFALTVFVPDVWYESDLENCQPLIPTCEQEIKVDKQEDGGTGECNLVGVSSGNKSSSGAGERKMLCAQVKKCEKIAMFVCRTCSVTCTATYK